MATPSEPNELNQMYLRLGELPLYLSRSASEGGFKRMKDGYFKSQAVSPLVEEVLFLSLLLLLFVALVIVVTVAIAIGWASQHHFSSDVLSRHQPDALVRLPCGR